MNMSAMNMSDSDSRETSGSQTQTRVGFRSITVAQSTFPASESPRWGKVGNSLAAAAAPRRAGPIRYPTGSRRYLEQTDFQACLSLCGFTSILPALLGSLLVILSASGREKLLECSHLCQ
jgi:hypothetical protein